jgi:hypothetical protein
MYVNLFKFNIYFFSDGISLRNRATSVEKSTSFSSPTINVNHKPWQSIFDAYNIQEHDFSKSPFVLTAEKTTVNFTSTTEREVSVLYKQDTI